MTRRWITAGTVAALAIVVAACAVVVVTRAVTLWSWSNPTIIEVLIPEGYRGALIVVADGSGGELRKSDGRVMLDFREQPLLRVSNISAIMGVSRSVPRYGDRVIAEDHSLANPAPDEIVFRAGGTGSDGVHSWVTMQVGTRGDFERLDRQNWGSSMAQILKNPSLLRLRDSQ